MAFRRFAEGPSPLGIRCSPDGPLISHLLYADDVLVFAMAEQDSCVKINKILADYGSWTGQAINRTKCSMMFSKRVPQWKCRRLAATIGCPRSSTLSYLGVTLKLGALRASDFDRTLQQLNGKLHGWGARHLSLAGRLTLINSALLMGPVYLLSHCLMPRSVMQCIEKAARNFLWHGNDSGGLHYVAWNVICKPKEAGGLGVHGLQLWRPALLARHALRFLQGGRYLLKDCLVARYGHNLGQTSFKRADSPTWKLLCDGYKGLERHIAWEVGKGDNVSCLLDQWINGRCLHRWPTFLNCEEDPPRFVSSLLSPDGQWSREHLLQFCGPALADYIAQVPLLGNEMEDKAELNIKFCGRSTSSFVYRQAWADDRWEHSWLWNLKLSPKETMFWWRICNNAIPTCAWLSRRGLLLDDRCPWGCNVTEDMSHILIHCQFLEGIFKILDSWGFTTPRVGSLPQLFDWLQAGNSGRNRNVRRSLYCSVVYQNWRNRLAFTHGRSFASPRTAAALLLDGTSCSRSSPIRYWDTNANPGENNPSSWCPPPYGWLKANFDGALHPNGLGGCAVVIRNHMGNLVAAFGSPIRHWDCSIVELQGLLLIKKFPWQELLEANGIILEGDSINVIKHIKDLHAAMKRSVDAEVVQPYTFLLNFHNVIFHHVLREHNTCADWAANMAIEHEFEWRDTSLAPRTFCNLLDQEKAPLIVDPP